MAKKKRLDEELRFYEVPHGECVLVLSGPEWRRNYGYFRQHIHNLDEIGFCLDGHGYLQSGDREWEFHKNTFTFFPHNIPHNTDSETPESLDTWEYLFFDGKSILEKYGGISGTQFERLHAQLGGTAIVADGKRYYAAACLVRGIVKRMYGPKDGYRRREVGYMLSALIMECASMASDEATSAPAEENNTGMIGNALSFVDDHFSEEIRTADLASACGLSETHFRRLFEKSINMSPNEYVNLVRIQKACDLIRFSDDSMETVAIKTGFNSQASFNRNFLKILGLPPYRWKREKESYRAAHKIKITDKEGWR